LPDLQEAIALDRLIYIAEGEKDVETLRRYELAATCNSGGAGKWNPRFADYLAGANVVVISDNDQAGRDHAELVAKSLASTASRLRILKLSGLAEKGDVSDWFAAGGTVETFNELADKAPEWQPNTDNDPRPPIYSDAELALRFADRHAGDLRHVDLWNKWMEWNGCRWAVDITRHTFSLALTICKEAAKECEKEATARLIASSKTRAAVVVLASEDRRIASGPEQWDTSPDTFNTERRRR
jgi:putative DNA primase/helicase